MEQDARTLENVAEDILAALDEAENKTKNAESVEEIKNIAANLRSKTPG